MLCMYIKQVSPQVLVIRHLPVPLTNYYVPMAWHATRPSFSVMGLTTVMIILMKPAVPGVKWSVTAMNSTVKQRTIASQICICAMESLIVLMDLMKVIVS